MKLWRWEYGRQGSGYRKFTLLFSALLNCDMYILHVPKGVHIPPHNDRVPFMNHFRVNITLRGKIWMSTKKDEPVFRIGSWFSYFRPDDVEHWAMPVHRDTYILSIGWLRKSF